MRVPANAPVKQFWSITLYDNLSRGPLITPQGAADLSSRKPELVSNADGSVDVDFGPIRPAGAKNWIQTTPGKGWFAYFQLLRPQRAVLRQDLAAQRHHSDPAMKTITAEAWLYAYAPLQGYQTLWNQTQNKTFPGYVGGFNRFRHYSRSATPADTDIVTPNNDTPYSWAWLDLRAEPIVLKLPAVPAAVVPAGVSP